MTGEHGIGVEKIAFMQKLFTDDDLAAMDRLRDAFNPTNRLSPDKMLPTAGGLRHGTEASRSAARRCNAGGRNCVVAKAPTNQATVDATPASCLPLVDTRSPADQAALVAAGARLLRSGHADLSDRRRHELWISACRRAKRGIGLSLDRAAIASIDYPARDMTITVEAGMTMRRLCANRWPPRTSGCRSTCRKPTRATLGGVVATNWSGPRRYGYGTMRDYVIGISAVDGRGMPFKGGGRVVKNVAGYDFCKLLTGSLGHARRHHAGDAQGAAACPSVGVRRLRSCRPGDGRTTARGARDFRQRRRSRSNCSAAREWRERPRG